MTNKIQNAQKITELAKKKFEIENQLEAFTNILDTSKPDTSFSLRLHYRNTGGYSDTYYLDLPTEQSMDFSKTIKTFYNQIISSIEEEIENI